MTRPIILDDISLSFVNKICFANFSAQILTGDRIAIIGRNGCGKSSLLNILAQKRLSFDGTITYPKTITIGHIEQTIIEFNELSGGQRFNKKLSSVLAQQPDLLLLDEPTNHLDTNNRQSLIRLLKRYQGTLIIVSHDTELLRTCIDRFWHIDNGQIHSFSGSYDDYQHEINSQRQILEKKLAMIKHECKKSHVDLMQEQHRAKKSKHRGQKSIQQKKWPTVVSHAKAGRAEKIAGNKQSAIDCKKQQLTEQLSALSLPEIILPKFSLTTDKVNHHTILSISHANIGYTKNKSILKNINLLLHGTECIAIGGKNGSGKSTLIKAILGDEKIYTTGDWYLPKTNDIGYLDQHYQSLDPKSSLFDHIRSLKPDWGDAEIRRHLNDFLFRKNEEVTQPTAKLSGGEKARASLSLIAAQTPKLLVLDEITNNLDLETKKHVIQVLHAYPGALIIVSHDNNFLDAIRIDQYYTIANGYFKSLL